MTAFARPRQLLSGESLAGFSCGLPIVDAWAQRYAPKAAERGSAIVYVSYCEGVPAGFYMLSSHSICREDVSGGWVRRNSPEQIPAILLGMLGVDSRYKGQGLGARLLSDAIKNSLRAASIIGSKVLVVDPADDAAQSFYAHFGFLRLPGTTRMFLPLNRRK